MSLKFNEAIKIVAEKLLKAPKPKFETYSQDAAEISAKIDQELIKINSIFKGAVSNWEEITQLIKAEVPKLQYPFLRLKMPFAVEPQRVFVFSSDADQPVNLKTSVNHPAVENGYLNGGKLTRLFIWDLVRVIENISTITCSSGKIYKLGIETKQYSDIATFSCIKAVENEGLAITYSCALSLMFTNKSFCYINSSTFFYQTGSTFEKAKVMHNIRILLNTLVNQSSELSEVYEIEQLFHNKINDSGIDIGSYLLEAIPRYIPYLPNPGPLISAYGKLLQLKQSDSVQLSELMEVFGLK
ncbi:uncharacterized protein LOC110190273 [Drosophila serrata]|uniref:uncharacterized protein LOC110190273 n=1 Tax=Drosophila serrata TaxID=7274 RepID=UPI000A1CF858|nr:uncharacterized protein LOC110190273 [Drosophila serrata]